MPARPPPSRARQYCDGSTVAKVQRFLNRYCCVGIGYESVVHFYSEKKDSEELIRLLELILSRYRHLRRIYLSWDAASWHASKRLFDRIDEENLQATFTGSAFVDTAPLPAGAQFLNVIEGVFSGMARAVIHNSDYESVEAAKKAISLHFERRNTFFSEHPKRAGNRIWGDERQVSAFSEANNCKDPAYR